jgi:hypothetical protein
MTIIGFLRSYIILKGEPEREREREREREVTREVEGSIPLTTRSEQFKRPKPCS